MVFRALIASIVFAAPGCILGDCPRIPEYDDTVPVPAMQDENTAFNLRRCEMDVAACDSLCDDLFALTHPHTTRGQFTTCELLTDSATGAESVHYVTREEIGGCAG